MKLATHHQLAVVIFWFAQVLGVVSVLALLIFFGGTIIDELLKQQISVREDYSLFLLLLNEVLVAVAIMISWKRKRRGPILMLVLTILLIVIWGRGDINYLLLHIPLLFSGFLLLFYSYYKEWILKRKP